MSRGRTDGALSRHDLNEMARQPPGVHWGWLPFLGGSMDAPQGFSQAVGAKSLFSVTQSEPVALQVLGSRRSLLCPSSFPVTSTWHFDAGVLLPPSH